MQYSMLCGETERGLISLIRSRFLLMRYALSSIINNLISAMAYNRHPTVSVKWHEWWIHSYSTACQLKRPTTPPKSQHTGQLRSHQTDAAMRMEHQFLQRHEQVKIQETSRLKVRNNDLRSHRVAITTWKALAQFLRERVPPSIFLELCCSANLHISTSRTFLLSAFSTIIL